MGHRTALYDQHVALGGKIVDFGGWDMPLHYGSQMEEHHRVRRAAGMFDVSHMTIVDVQGDGAEAYLQRLLANDVAKLKSVGKALYSTMLNEQAGIVDDLIVYRLNDRYRVVVNCGTREKDLAWMKRNASGFAVQIDERPALAIVAVQGPQAIASLADLLPVTVEQVQALAPFSALYERDILVARTGYTGEDGVEVLLPGDAAVTLWQALLTRDVAPAGLAARDTLRLEAGMCLYGQDMDDTTHPLESNLGWTVAWKPEQRHFVGRSALATARRDGVARQLTGVVLEGKGVMRHGYAVVLADGRRGEVTSGIFSPTLGYSIGLARLPTTEHHACSVDIRGKLLPARLVKPPFVRHGKSLV